MPEDPSATGTAPQGDPAAQGSDNSGSATSGAGAQDASKIESLSREAAKWRTQYRETQKQVEALTAQIEELKTKSTASPGGEDASEVAGLKRQLADLQKSFKDTQERAQKAEEASRTEKLDNALIKAISEAGVLEPEDALIIARNKGRARIADDGKPVFITRDESGEEREVVISAASLKSLKLIPDRLFPAEGAAGSGSRGGSRGAGATGVDFERGLRDLDYFTAHEKEMREEMRRRQSA
jgi:uncharacterized coiled-coil protein SlyX